MTKYRVGRKLGTVILTVDGTKEIAHCTSKEIAQEICILLNGTKPVNVDLGDISDAQLNTLADKELTTLKRKTYSISPIEDDVREGDYGTWGGWKEVLVKFYRSVSNR